MPESAPKPLTLKQRRFVEEYAASDGNAVQAYFRAFGRHTTKGTKRSYRAAQVNASKLLSTAIIQAELSVAQASYAQRIGVSKERVLTELAALAFSDPDDIYEADEGNGGLPAPKPWRDIPPAARKAIQSVKVKRKRLTSDKDSTSWEIEELEYRFHSKTDALDKLCKKLGFYTDANDESAKATVPVELLTRILALAGARQPLPQPGGAGGAQGGNAVVPESGAAK